MSTLPSVADLQRKNLAEQKAVGRDAPDRGQSPTPTPAVEPKPSDDIASNTAIQQYDNTSSSTEVLQTVQPYSGIANNTASSTEVLPAVEAMFESQSVVVTFRLPVEVADWLGDRAHQGRKQGVTRQSQIWDSLKVYISEEIAKGGK